MNIYKGLIFILRKIKKPLFLTVFIFLHIFILNNFILLSMDTIYGDYSAADISPAPRYQFLRVEVQDYRSFNRLSVDFAQVYFPSKEFSSLIDNYVGGTFDPWRRSSRYAPFIHFVCAISICKFDYGYAAFLSMLLQLALFYFSLFSAFKLLKLKKFIMLSVLLVNFCLFMTPVGITWFERGQFSLYVALAYLWLVLGLHTRNGWFIVLSALFSFVKWTSLPFIFVILAVEILVSSNRKELIHNILFAGIFASMFVFLSLPFFSATKYFLIGLYQQEQNLYPKGLSLILLLPRVLVKAMPLLLIGLGWLASHRQDNQPLQFVPYFTGAAILLITFPTVAFDYSLPVLLGFIPFQLAWASLPDNTGSLFSRFIIVFYSLFFVSASFSGNIKQIIQIDHADILLYALTGLILVCIPLFYHRGNN